MTAFNAGLLTGWHLGDLLDCVEGVCYAVDRSYRLVATGSTRWDEFARSNGAKQLTSAAVLGTNIIDMVQDEDVRDIYRRHFHSVIATARPVALSSRCDSPGVKRELRLSMTPLHIAGLVYGILVQAVTVSETVRPPIDLFDAQKLAALFENESVLPIITLCSFCQRIKALHRAEWQEAEEYYRAGGTSKVRISHGLCGDCAVKHNYVDEIGQDDSAAIRGAASAGDNP
ncbi:MAG: hypothetical protein JO001_09875 [Alphaproteobacteria bacterium]|nr:hypothetical protein [Alphaproteobacteria bacterium]